MQYNMYSCIAFFFLIYHYTITGHKESTAVGLLYIESETLNGNSQHRVRKNLTFLQGCN